MKLARNILLLTLISCSLSVLADNFATVDGIRYKLNNDATASVWLLKEYKSDDGILSIPASIIVNDTIYEVNTLTSSLGLTDSVDIHSLVIPASITYIYYDLSRDFPQLTSIIVEEGNPVYDSRDNCNAIIETKTNTLICGCKNTVIPLTIDTIGSYAFYFCKGLTEIIIPTNVKKINKYGFSFCDSLSSIIVEEGNPVYDSRDNCNAIIDTKTNTLICGCKNTVIPHTIDTIGEGAFTYCKGLTDIAIPSNVSVIGKWAFTGSDLKRVIIPNGTRKIQAFAFKECEHLNTVTFSNTVTDIEKLIFSFCDSLSSIIVEEGNPVYDSRDNCNAIIETKTNTLICGCKNTVIPHTIDTIGSFAFHRCKGLTEVAIPLNVSVIGTEAFAYSGLKRVLIPYGVKTIKEEAFTSCYQLKTVFLSNTVTNIGESAFSWCSDLESVYLSNSLTNIESKAFSWCKRLKSIYVPNSVKTIAKDAFRDCDSLKIKILPNERSRYKSNQNDLQFAKYSIPIITQRLIDWVEQKEGERQSEWIARVTEDSIRYMQHKIYKSVEAEYIQKNLPKYTPKFIKDVYLPNDQCFIFKDEKFGKVSVFVPNNEAEYVDKNWKGKIKNYTLHIQDEKILVESLTILLPNGKTYSTKL